VPHGRSSNNLAEGAGDLVPLKHKGFLSRRPHLRFFAISDADERGQFGRRAKRLSAEAADVETAPECTTPQPPPPRR
jgi:hypothetical protein